MVVLRMEYSPAIEDGLSEQIVPKGYHLQTLPILFGCSILYPANSIPQKALKKLVELENGTTPTPSYTRINGNQPNDALFAFVSILGKV